MTSPLSIDLTGPLASVRFPNLCVSCGAPPAGDVLVEKMFRRTHGEQSTTYHVAAVRAPLCAACLARHRAEETPVDPAVLRRLRLTWVAKVLPYVIPLGVSGFFVTALAPKVVATIPRLAATPPQWDALIWAAPTALFAGLFLMFVMMSRDAGRPLIATHLGHPNDTHVRTVRGLFGALYVVPGPPTSPVAALDFGDEQSELFAANRRAFTFANAEVGAQFATLNAARVWDPASPVAVRARRLDRALFVVVIAAGIVALVVQLIRGG